MATSSVSALDQDTYQLIQTNTTTSGTTSTFSGLSGYKKYMVAWEGVNRASGGVTLTFNGSTSNYFGGGYLLTSSQGHYNISSGIKCSYNFISGATNGLFIIDNVNNGAPKIVKGELTAATDDWNQTTSGGWLTTDSITSITFTSGGAFSAGSMKLYGIAG
jgi:hypothetical protein